MTDANQTPPLEPSPPPDAPPPPSGAPPDNTERTWAMCCHLSALAGLLGIPFGNVIGPLVIWLIKKDEFPAVDREGKKALNFQISVAIYMLACVPLIFALVGFLLLPAVGIFAVIMTIIAAIRTSNGEDFRYPLSITFIK